MKELIVIRHGHAQHMEKNLTGGSTAGRLSALGIKQAELTGERLREMLEGRSVKLHCSNQTRAMQTAEIIAHHLQVKYTSAPELREIENGEAADLTQEEAAEIALPITEPLVDWQPYLFAETWRQMSERVEQYLESLDQEQDVTVLVVHTGSGNAAIGWWLGLGIGEKNIAFQLDCASINVFNMNSWQERSVARANDTQHLTSLT